MDPRGAMRGGMPGMGGGMPMMGWETFWPYN
jgi:hypothetical protein